MIEPVEKKAQELEKRKQEKTSVVREAQFTNLPRDAQRSRKKQGNKRSL